MDGRAKAITEVNPDLYDGDAVLQSAGCGPRTKSTTVSINERCCGGAAVGCSGCQSFGVLGDSDIEFGRGSVQAGVLKATRCTQRPAPTLFGVNVTGTGKIVVDTAAIARCFTYDVGRIRVGGGIKKTVSTVKFRSLPFFICVGRFFCKWNGVFANGTRVVKCHRK